MPIRMLIPSVSLALALLSLPALCADKEVPRPKCHWPQWRGPDRLNLSPDKGLLTKWPKDGPPLAWQVNGIGQGVGPVAVAAGKVYILGHRDKDEHLTAIDEATGKPLWSVPLGLSHKEFDPMRWLSHRTPLVEDGRVYSVTARGELTCVSETTARRGRAGPFPESTSGEVIR
jgi:PQQ-like domain